MKCYSETSPVNIYLDLALDLTVPAHVGGAIVVDSSRNVTTARPGGAERRHVTA